MTYKIQTNGADVAIKSLGLELSDPTITPDLEKTYPSNLLFGNTEVLTLLANNEILILGSAKDGEAEYPIIPDEFASPSNLKSAVLYVLSEDYTVTGGSPARLLLDPDNATRQVFLPPPESVPNLSLIIVNIGSEGKDKLQIVENGGNVLTLSKKSNVRCYVVYRPLQNDFVWYAEENYKSDKTQQLT